MRYFFVSIIILFAASAAAQENCLEKAQTQSELNQCQAVKLADAKQEMERVLNRIYEVYETDPMFLKKVVKSQRTWEASMEADIEMMYPAVNKREQYGSSYAMCRSSEATSLVIQRIAWLKRWLKGHDGEDVCTGSIKHSYCILNDCSSIRD